MWPILKYDFCNKTMTGKILQKRVIKSNLPGWKFGAFFDAEK